MINSSLFLKFQKCSSYLFVEKIINLDIWLVDGSDQVQLGEEIPFTLKLGLQGDLSPKYDHLFQIIKGIPKIELNGKCQLNIKLLDISASFGDVKFAFHAYPLLPQHSHVHCGLSSPITFIRHCLVVENQTQIPTLWYKDTGGKKNCIDIQVKLCDENGCVVGRQIPLKVELCYSLTGERVKRPNILEIAKDTKLHIDANGFATIRVRIEEVSAKHNGKLFSIRIFPDTLKDPQSIDVGPARCHEVEVRSKKTIPKRMRQINYVREIQFASKMPPQSIKNGPSHSKDDESPMKKARLIDDIHLPSQSSSILTNDLIHWSQKVMATLWRIKTSQQTTPELTKSSSSSTPELINQLLSSYENLSQSYPILPSWSVDPLNKIHIDLSEVNHFDQFFCNCKICRSSDTIDSLIDFPYLPPMDASYRENSLSLNIAGFIEN